VPLCACARVCWKFKLTLSDDLFYGCGEMFSIYATPRKFEEPSTIHGTLRPYDFLFFPTE